MISSHSRPLRQMLNATSTSIARSVISGLPMEGNGSSSLRRVRVSLSRRLSSSAVPSVGRSQLAGTLDVTVFQMILSRKQIAQPYGLWSAQRRLSTTLVSPTHTSCISTFIPRRSVPVSVVVWVEWRVCRRCLRIVAMRRRCRTTSCKRRKLP